MIIEITQYIHIIEQTANNCDILFKINTNITNNYLYFIIYSRSNKRAKFNSKYRVRSNLPKEKKKEKKGWETLEPTQWRATKRCSNRARRGSFRV